MTEEKKTRIVLALRNFEILLEEDGQNAFTNDLYEICQKHAVGSDFNFIEEIIETISPDQQGG